MQQEQRATSEMDLVEDETLSNLGEAQVVIQIARWRALEKLDEIEHQARVQRTAEWVSRKVRHLMVRARLNNTKYRDSQDILDGIMVDSMYENPGPLRKKFRNSQIDSLIRAANFYLSHYATQNPPHKST